MEFMGSNPVLHSRLKFLSGLISNKMLEHCEDHFIYLVNIIIIIIIIIIIQRFLLRI